MYQQLLCAGKKLHETLIEEGNEGVADMVERYHQECQIMSSLHHPNITQFLGICFLPGAELPLLVMEQLESNLDDLLENFPNLPPSLKHSILMDTARGLLYLHKRQPPVVHRDLTAKNVLLTSSLVAKITDMGNSRILDMAPGMSTKTLSRLPGTLVYMPPEALDDVHRYGPSLDIFSFGHLALFTLTQVTSSNPHLDCIGGLTCTAWHMAFLDAHIVKCPMHSSEVKCYQIPYQSQWPPLSVQGVVQLVGPIDLTMNALHACIAYVCIMHALHCLRMYNACIAYVCIMHALPTYV